MDGISPRYVINQLSRALIREGVTCINPISALRVLRDGLDQHTSITKADRERYLNLIDEARREYDELAKTEVQKAFVYSFEESARTVLNNYLDNVEAFCNRQKVRDPLTEGHLLFDNLVGIAHGANAHQLLGRVKLPSEDGEHVHSRVRLALQ